MSDVFISYSRMDKNFVRRLHDALASQKRDVWVDWEDIPLTANWWQEICTGIEAADTFVFIITPESAKSDVCRQEIDHAMKHKKRFVPVLYRPLEPDSTLNTHPAINSHNWIMFREEDAFDDAFNALLSVLETDLDYVRAHTRLLVRAREWENNNKGSSYLLDGPEISLAEQWLATGIDKKPEPTSLHSEYVLQSRRYDTARQRRILGGVVVAFIVALGLAVFGFVQSQIAQTEANNRATQQIRAQNNEALAIAAQETAVRNADERSTAQAQSQNNEATAIAAGGTIVAEANQRGTAQAQAVVALADAATAQAGQIVAQETAVAEGNQRVTQQIIAVENASTAVAAQATVVAEVEQRSTAQAQAVAALADAATAQAGQIVAQETAVAEADQRATVQANLLVAQNTAVAEAEQRGTAQAQAVVALANAATAQVIQATSQAGELNAQSTAVAEAVQRGTAQAQAVAALANAATAQVIQATSQAGELNAQSTAVAEAEQRGTAQAQAVVALANAATAQAEQATVQADLIIAQGTAVAEAEQRSTAQAEAVIALEGAATAQSVQATAQARELSAQGTAIAEAEQRATAQIEAINNAATAVAAQATAEYNAVQALSQSLAVSAEQAVGNLDYDLAFALALESNRLNPTLVQNRRLLNNIVYTAARFSFPGSAELSFNPDSTHVLATSGSTLTVWDLVTRQPVMALNSHTGTILTAAFSPDGTRIASAGTDNTLIIWDAASGQPLHTLTGHEGAINSLTWSPDSRWIITGSDDRKMFRWDANTGGIIFRYENNAHRVVRVQYSASGLRFFAWTKPSENEQTMLILRVDNGASAYGTVNAHEIYQSFNREGRAAITGGLNGYPLRTVIADTGAQERQFTRDIDYTLDTVTASALNNTGSEIIIGFDSGDPSRRRLVLYSVANGEPVQRFVGEGVQQVDALAFSPDGTLVISGSNNQLVVWNVETGTEVRRLSSHNAPVDSIRFSTDGRYAISAARNGDWRVWDVTGGDTAEQGRVAVNVQDNVLPVFGAAYSPDGSTLYAGVWTDFFFYNAQTRQQVNRVSTGDNMINAIYSTVRPRALAILENAAIYYNMENGNFIDYLGRSGETYTGQAAIGPDGDSVVLEGRVLYAYGPDLRPIRVWENKSSLYPGPQITGLAITPDDSAILIASGNPDNPDGQPYPLVMLDTATGAEIRRFDNEHTATITGVSVSPDGRYALTTSGDHSLIVWDIASGRLLRRLSGHTGTVNAVGISADSRFALSGSDDGSLILWDIRAGEPVRRFIGHTQPVQRVFFSGDGRSAISADASRTLILWRIQAQEDVITWAQANRFIPGLSCAERVQFNVPPLC